MSANLVPTDATLCHYGAGKGYVPGISVLGSSFSTNQSTTIVGPRVTMTDSFPMVDSTDSATVGSHKSYRGYETLSTSTGFPIDSNYDQLTFRVTTEMACNTSVDTNGGQNGTNRANVNLAAFNQNGDTIDMILFSNYIKMVGQGQSSAAISFIGSGVETEHVLIGNNGVKNTNNALGVRGRMLFAHPGSTQGDPFIRISPSIPVSGSTPVGTIREIQLNDPLQAGPFAFPLSYLAGTNTICLRSNGLANNRTIPISECGATFSTTAVNTAGTFAIAGASYNTTIGAGGYAIGSGSITLPSDSLGKTYIFDVTVPCSTAGAIAIASSVELRVAAVVIGRNNFNGAIIADGVNVCIHSFYASVANSEVVTLVNTSGQTLTPGAGGKITIREAPRSDA